MRRIRRRTHARWCAWAVSGVLHAGAMIVLSAALQPIDLDHVGERLLSAELAPDPPKLDALEAPRVEWADALPTPDLFDLGEEFVPSAAFTEGLEQGAESVEFESELSLVELVEDLTLEIRPQTSPGRKKTFDRRRRLANRAGKQATFFGTVAYGDVFVYVLDMSGSMSGPRFARARDELVESVEALAEKQSFYVLLFNGGTRRMFDGQSTLDEAVQATTKNKRRLRHWLSKIQPEGGTDPRDALRIGLSLRPSALFLLSDGEFHLDNQDRRRRLRHGDSKPADMIGKRRSSKIPIHTFAYESREAAATMQTLSSETGGEYRFVPPAPPQAANQAAQRQRGNVNSPAGDALAVMESEVLLMQAEALESRGQLAAALAGYQKIIDAYPQTDAAREADLHKSLLSSFSSP